jgi:formylmethanofuran dehydrogenase subunit E
MKVELAETEAVDALVAGSDLETALTRSAERHGRLCPRQVLGVRIGFAGVRLLQLPASRRAKQLLLVAETDGCFLDGLEAATGCTPGHRTLRIDDYGKAAATFVNVETRRALRISVAPDVRQRAFAFVPGESRRYYAQLLGYQRMPDCELLRVQPVALVEEVSAIVGRPGVRVDCAGCDEEIINGREQIRDGRPYCRACLATAYYRADVES